jgi:ABC-type antimicrobial peptide transport system permease subunit
MDIVGYVRDAAYYDVREPMHPTVYVPMVATDGSTFFVRTAGNPWELASTLRVAVAKARSGFSVRTIEDQAGFVRWQMLRERLLASLSLFFSIVALVLAAIRLYGVLNYSVSRKRREIGIRMAVGARPIQVVRLVTSNLLAMVSLGLFLGVVAGVACGRVVESLLFEVKPTDTSAIAVPLLALLSAAIMASLPPAIRAARIDPAQTLRSE